MEADTPLFASLPKPALDLIRRTVETRHYKLGDVMVAEGETRAELFILLSGEAEVEGLDWHGNTMALAHLGAGQCFGELSMLSGEPASATVKAAADTEVWVLPHAKFVAIAADYPQLAQNLSTLLGERLRLSNERQLRAQRGRLIVLLGNQGAPWTFWLAYRLAQAVARHARKPISFLDMSGRAGDWLAPVQASPLNDIAVDGSPSTAAGAGAAEGLHVVVGTDEQSNDREVSLALDRLRERSAYVLAFVPEDTPASRLILAQSDSSLRLTLEAGAGDDWGGEEGKAVDGLVVLSERQTQPSIRDIQQAQAKTSLPIRAILPGGVQGFEHDYTEESLCGKAIGRLARSLIGKTVGLALGGGGAKGYAHLGVLKGLQRAGVPFDCVAGCSIGAPLAAGVAAGWEIDQIRDTLDRVSQKAMRPNVPLISVLSSRSIRMELRAVTQDLRFEDLPIPLGFVAVDIENGEEVLLRRGLIWPATVASMAYPGIYEPVRIGSRFLVDGGVLNPVPVSAALSLGADVVISSNLSGTIGERMAKVGSSGPPRRRFIVENITRTLEIMQSKIVEESLTRADVAIQPSFGTPLGLLDFKRGRELEHVGEEAVERQLSELRSVLPWLA